MDKDFLESIRKDIDRIDDSIADLLVRRMAAVDKIASWKKKNGMPVAVPAREEEIICNLREKAGDFCADEIESVYRTIFAVSRKRQEKDVE
jgi:chorismate mutase/prephenate dehydratase